MLSQAINNNIVLHFANAIELAVLSVVEYADHRSYGLLEDIVSECTLHLLDKALNRYTGQLDNAEALEKFITVAVSRKAMDILRLFVHSRADMTGDFADFQDSAPSPVAGAERSMAAAALDSALAQLCDSDRIFAGLLLTGNTAADAAAVVGMSAPTASRRRKDLHSHLGGLL
jgi:hypothetical protein